MRQTVWTLFLGCALLAAAAVPTVAGDQDFVLANETGVVIDKVFVSPSDQNSWGEDVLGKDTLENEQSVEIKFSREESSENWDLKVVDSEGTEITWQDLQLTKIRKVTLHFEKGEPSAAVE